MKKVISLKAAKYEKAYKEFYSNKNNMNLGFFNKKDTVYKTKIS